MPISHDPPVTQVDPSTETPCSVFSHNHVEHLLGTTTNEIMMVEQIGAEELRSKLEDDEELQIIDVRSEPAFNDGHIPGARNVPFNKLTDIIETIDWGKRVVFVCPHGVSSLHAARLLEAYEGFEEDAQVMNLESGYISWSGEIE